MRTRQHQPGLTLVELVVLLVIIVVLAAILFPLHHHPREKATQTACLSQIRQLSTAVQMYCQDNKDVFPGMDWTAALLPYLGNSKLMLWCPTDETAEGKEYSSYGYSGQLLKPDGTGIQAKDIKAPTEIGILCDADPARPINEPGIVGGGAFLEDDSRLVYPKARHSKGIVIGYADGHTKYVNKGVDDRDISNPITRAFIMTSALGFIDNPTGGVNHFTLTGSPGKCKEITLGGDPCTQPILKAAAVAWQQTTGTPFTSQGFKGQFATTGQSSNAVWGCADGTRPAGHAVPIARDAMVVIISRNSKITSVDLGEKINDVHVLDAEAIRTLFGTKTGMAPKTYQAYTYDTNSGSRRFFTRNFCTDGTLMQTGKKAIAVTDDLDMVDKVANDPYGIGYCSAAFADIERVEIVSLKMQGKTYFYPQEDSEHRWQIPAKTDWPLMRTLYAVCSGDTWNTEGTAFANQMLAPGGAGTKAIQAGPLFTASYMKP